MAQQKTKTLNTSTASAAASKVGVLGLAAIVISSMIGGGIFSLPQTYGVPVEEIQEGIKYGVRKVNVDTDLRMAMTGAIRRVFATKPEEFDPRKYLKPAIEAMQAVCEARYEEFGAAGHASSIKTIPLSDMAKRYASGELDPQIK